MTAETTTAAQLTGRNQSGWLAAFWTEDGKIAYRVIATPAKNFDAGLMICYGWSGSVKPSYEHFGGDVGETLAWAASYTGGYEPVTGYPLHAFCNRCGEPVSLDEGSSGWHHDAAGSRDLMPYRSPQPLPGPFVQCEPAGGEETTVAVLTCGHMKRLPVPVELPDVTMCGVCDPDMEREITAIVGDGDETGDQT